MRKILLAMVYVVALGAAQAEARTITIIAAENVYGDIARQIGGSDVAVKSVLNNPGQDPHLFEISPSLARDVAEADLVVVNGVDYDPWMDKLLSATSSNKRQVISAAELLRAKAGDNPHLWYDLKVGKLMGDAIAEKLALALPQKAVSFRARAATFAQSLDPLAAQIADIARQHAAAPVAATEPVFNYMLEAMGLDVQEKEFQLAVMNGTEPSVSDVARFADDLKNQKIRLLVYNKQVTDPVADKFLNLAKEKNIPVVAVTETMPAGKSSYQQWLGDEIAAVAKALGSGN